MELEPTLIAVFLTGLLGGVHCAGMCGGIVGAIGLLGGRAPGGAGGRSGSVDGAARGSAGAVASTSFGASARVSASSGLVAVPISMPRPRAPSASRPDELPAGSAPVSATGRRAPWSGASSARSGATVRLARLLPYNAGRLASYTVLGAAAGTAGSFGWLLGDALPLQQGAFALTNGLLILMGLYVAGARRLGHALESLGRAPWARIRPLATASLARAGSMPGALLAGALWGLVPCGMVYAVLVAALLGGSASHGAALMLAFGLGTLPNLLLLGVSSSLLARLTRRPRVRLAFGLAIAAFGMIGLMRLDVATALPVLGDLCAHLPRHDG